MTENGGRGGGEGKCLCIISRLTRRSCVRGEKLRFMASYSTSNKLLLVSRHILTTGLQNCLSNWQCKPRNHCHRLPLLRNKYAPEVKAAAKGLKRRRVKVKG